MEESNTGSNIEVAKPPVFNGEAERVGEFIMIYRLYLKMRMREAIEKEEKKEKEQRKKKKQRKGKTMQINKVAEKWEIWNEKEEATRSEEKAKKLVPEQFHKWIKVFGKKASERMLIRKIWDHVIDLKEEFASRKGKV